MLNGLGGLDLQIKKVIYDDPKKDVLCSDAGWCNRSVYGEAR